MKKALFTMVWVIITMPALFGQHITTEGKDFWVGFCPNHDNSEVDLTLFASGKETTSGRVATADGSFVRTFTVTPGQVTTISIPRRFTSSIDSCETAKNLALHVTSHSNISLFASNFEDYTYDITNVLPTTTLRNDYILQSYESSGANEFCIVATQNNSKIYIKMPCNSTGRFRNGETDSITLNAGQHYLVSTSDYASYTNPGDDISGTHIWSEECKNFAVFMGSQCALVPVGSTACDHLYEQAIPTLYWGCNFGITTSESRTSDLIKVTAKDNNTTVHYLNNTVTLNAYQSHTFEVDNSTQGFLLTSSKPVSVFLYLEGAGRAGVNGDPSYVVIHPLEQHINEITFATYNSPTISNHYVNVVIPSVFRNEIQLDGAPIAASNFHSMTGTTNYLYAKLTIADGAHTLHSTRGAFNAHVYGLGYFESYAYSAGTSLDPINGAAYLNNIPSTLIDSTNNTYCLCDTLTFRAEVLDSTNTVLTWLYGDGSGDVGATTKHRYTQPGKYQVSLAMTYVDDCMTICSDTIKMWVNIIEAPTSTTDTSVCGLQCIWNNETYTDAGAYWVKFHTGQICDSTAILHLKALHQVPEEHIEFDYDCLSREATLSAVGDATYFQWSCQPPSPMLESQRNEQSITITNDTNRTFHLTIAYEGDTLCSSTASYSVEVIPDVHAYIEASTLEVNFDNLEVRLMDKSTGSSRRNWIIQDEPYSIEGTVEYGYPATEPWVKVVLDAYNNYDCHDTASAIINMNMEGLLVPNIITPTKYTNNTFGVTGVNIDHGEIWIYDRRGTLVFHTDDILQTWDATYKGAPVPTGTYVYRIRYAYSSAPQSIQNTTGTVTVVR